MSKAKGPNQKSKYKALNSRLARYVLLVEKMYEAYNLEASKIALSTGYDGTKPFSFADYPITKARLKDLLQEWRNDLNAVINKGTASEWAQSNHVQDMLADKTLSYYYGKEHWKRKRKYYQTNSDALKAFQQRAEKGMNLSQKIWTQSQDYKTELEAALSVGIQKGMSAVTLSKRVSKYLNDYDKLKADYKQKYGKATDSLNCEYRSIRLARSEINMAYRTAEWTRWQQMDFVIGFEIKLSKSHHDRMPHGDICDDLAGKYPKDFKWTGWHPNDMCYCVPVLASEEEFFSDEESEGKVSELPGKFCKWIDDNTGRLSVSVGNGTLPYWIKDNKDVRDCVKLVCSNRKVGNELQSIAGKIATKNKCIVTELNYKTFSSLYRKLTNPYDPTSIDNIKDSVRNTIIVDKGMLGKVVNDLKRAEGFERYKPQTTDYGYTGNIVNVRLSNGVVGEIQVNTPYMIYAKERPVDAKRILGEELWERIHKETGIEGGLGHEYYEKGRNMEPGKELDAIKKKSREYYSHFS